MKNKMNYYIAALVALATFIVYLPALRNEFVNWDDGLYVFLNVHIRSFDASFFRWAFFDFHASNWHPLTWISHAFDYALWSMNPLGHHLTSIILHSINTAFVVVLALKLLGIARQGTPQNPPTSFLTDRTILIAAGVTGSLFGLHPVHVESVAWVAERKDLLCAFFFLLSMMMYVNFVRRQETGDSREQTTDSGNDKAGQRSIFINKHYLLAFGCFVLALMSKPMAVTLPCVLLILDWYPFHRIRSLKTVWAAGIEKIPFFALSLASSIITIMAQRAGDAIVSLEFTPLSVRVPVAVQSVVEYLGKMLLPMNLIPFYPYPDTVPLFSIKYLLVIGLVVGITAVCVVLVKKQKLWLSAWGYYVVTLVPVLGIVQVGGQSMADRYTYLPSLGPFLIMGLCAAWIAEKVPLIIRKGMLMTIVRVAGALCLVISLSYLTVKQIAVWRNSVGLWTYIIGKEPERVPLAYNNRGTYFYTIGLYDRAIEDYNHAIILKSSVDVYSNLGMAYYKIGRLDEAIENFNNAISMNPKYSKAYNNRASVFRKMGRLDEAIADYRKAIALAPSSPQAYYNLGVLHAQNGLFDQAIEYYSQALAIDPNYADAYSNRGIAFSFRGHYDRALDDFNKALDLNQNPAADHVNRGNLYLDTGRKQLAIADYQKACNLGNDVGCNVLRQLTQGFSPN